MGNDLALYNMMHPDLKSIVDFARAKGAKFRITCSVRNKANQELAFASGNSNAHFGESPHNFSPSLAFDFIPLDNAGLFKNEYWRNAEMFETVANQLLNAAKELHIAAEWGGNFKSIKDRPHFQLANWKSIKGKLAQ